MIRIRLHCFLSHTSISLATFSNNRGLYAKIPSSVFLSGSSASSVFSFYFSTRIKTPFAPPRASFQNDKFSGTFYDILGIAPDESLYSIKAAYRQLVRKYHPDVHSSKFSKEESTHCFLVIKEAYEILSDPSARAIYDYELRNPLGTHLNREGYSFHSTQCRPWFQRQYDPLWANQEEKEEMLKNWKVQWKSQLNGLKRKRRKHASWASNFNKQKTQEDLL